MLRLVASVALGAVAALTTTAALAARQPLQHITIVGDSVAGSIAFEPTAAAVLTRADDVDLELAACRRLTAPSCYVTGMTPPPTALDVLTQLGRAAGPVVVIDVGYNDDSSDYRQGMNRVLALLRRNGVQHVVWLTLRARWHDYVAINDEIRAEARSRPWVTVADWNRYSRSHPDWFQSDGIHLEAAGAEALAGFVHRTLARLGLTGPTKPTRRKRARPHAPSLRLAAANAATTHGRDRSQPVRGRQGAISDSTNDHWIAAFSAAAILVAALGAIVFRGVVRRRQREKRRRELRRLRRNSALNVD